ncbi:MAG: hypothetical protein KAJ50_03615, partial [Bacteroidales bacterium]|nr:hypothetical protein [Bacteroidales bacterium]
MSWELNVPWNNEYYTIYKLDPGSTSWISVATTPDPFYVDSNLINGDEYCYYIESTGSYGTPGLIDPIINYSQL